MWVQSKYITKHLKKHEEGEIIQCEICQQEFPDVLMFKVHVRNVGLESDVPPDYVNIQSQWR